MEKANIEMGTEYGFRDRPARIDEPLQRIMVLASARGKWRVRFLDEPSPGLEVFVVSRHLVVRWKDRAAFLREEMQEAELDAFVERSSPPEGHPLTLAVDAVLASTGEDAVTIRGILSIDPEALGRICQRASIARPGFVPPAYLDSRGLVRFPFEVAMMVAKGFAAAEPSTALLHVDTEERQRTLEVRQESSAFLLALLERDRAGWALVRQWAGFDQAIAEREKEISRLQKILNESVWELRSSGHDDHAANIERKLGGR